jgi:polyhydroxyalkanoate synthesis repressor PhaR
VRQTGYHALWPRIPAFQRERAALRILKKYPNRRLYDTEQSAYVTLEDVRKMILTKEPVKVVDSKTGHDLTRSVLLQIISEQEAEGHEPLLTNKVLEQVIRFYGDSMQGVLSRYLEQSIFTFLEQQELYQRRMREVLNANPLKLMQKLADQNIAFLRSLMPGAPVSSREPRAERGSESEPPPDAFGPQNGVDADVPPDEPQREQR